MAIIYVTRDIERALGGEPSGPYFIVANQTPYSESVQKKYPENVFLIDERPISAEPLDTFELLKAAEKIIGKIAEKSAGKKAKIVVFKNTTRIEEFCLGKKWQLLNPKAALAEEIENKITQVRWLGNGKTAAGKYLPPHDIMKVSEITLDNPKIPAHFMIQWAHSHTGDGTIFIAAGPAGKKTLAQLQEKFPDREARVTTYIKGPVFTANICVTAGKNPEILIGNISSQITGMLPFTDNPWSTIGNDWSLPHSILSGEQIEHFHEIAHAVGNRMRESGWVGLFGIDCIYDAERGNLHLIEVNARQPASTTYESQLQEKIRTVAPEHFRKCGTIFEAHLAALQNKKTVGKLIEISDGAQIILRIPAIKELRKIAAETSDIAAALRARNYNVIEYPNTKPGNDLLRIQSERDILESDTKFNKRGKEILEIITDTENKHYATITAYHEH